MDIYDYCCPEESNNFKQVKQYISQNGSDFETASVDIATEYFKKLSPVNGEIYIIFENSTFMFISPAAGHPGPPDIL